MASLLAKTQSKKQSAEEHDSRMKSEDGTFGSKSSALAVRFIFIFISPISCTWHHFIDILFDADSIF
ncbi:hypothetical protein Fmac_028251 [Flemingia macrophylla]|uniref:Uncharacterized protein n=1 Tax=Flemingia macrophylla TaxID=520843 RepID=A0ABD1L6Z2_9FABA